MDTFTFFRTFFVDLIHEIECPLVNYKGVSEFYQEGQIEPVIYVKYVMVSFNRHTNIVEYKAKLESDKQVAMSNLEKELYESPLWVLDFDQNQIIQELQNLKSNLYADFTTQEGVKKLSFAQIKFSNIGDAYILDFYEEPKPTEIKNPIKAREIFNMQLEEYSIMFNAYVDSIIAKVSLLFHKHSYNNPNYLEVQNKSVLIDSEKIHLEKLIQENKIEDCFELLFGYFKDHRLINNTLSALFYKFNKNKHDRSINIKKIDDFEVDESRIIKSILDIINAR